MQGQSPFRGMMLVALGFSVLSGPVAAQAPGVQLQRAGLELGYRAPQIVEQMGLSPGSVVASFGVSALTLLRQIVEGVGEEGRVYSVTRSESTYRGVEQSLLPEYGRRLSPIFAADGDAHLEVDQVSVLILVDTEGFFYQNADDLYRQVRTILPTGGKLVMLRLPFRPGGAGRVWPGEQQKAAPESPRGPSPAERLALERDGFYLVKEPDILKYREMWIFERRAPEPG